MCTLVQVLMGYLFSPNYVKQHFSIELKPAY
jgi:hypothetical protein